MYSFNSKFLAIYFGKKFYLGEITPGEINMKFVMEVEKYVDFLKIFEDKAYLGSLGYEVAKWVMRQIVLSI